MITSLKYLAVGLLLTVSACSDPSTPRDDDRIDVVAAFYPIAEAAERMGGPDVRVTNLTPAGAEPHDLELTTDALDTVLDADVVVYVKGFMPALDDAVSDATGNVVDLGDGNADPHVWLDPVAWTEAVSKMADALDAADTRYLRSIEGLDALYGRLRDCERDVIVTAHDAFGRLADRYDLRQEAITGVSPEAEPDPQRLAELADLVREERVTTIFTEELVSPKVAETLAREAGVKTAVLDPIESAPRGGYVAAMRRNLDTLREALDCE